ncbi:MAG: hypothetical protein HYU64_19050 [Armatimonadetes bacterium]|nr:hypothetical protein [Armatimonadota bacterium]
MDENKEQKPKQEQRPRQGGAEGKKEGYWHHNKRGHQPRQQAAAPSSGPGGEPRKTENDARANRQKDESKRLPSLGILAKLDESKAPAAPSTSSATGSRPSQGRFFWMSFLSGLGRGLGYMTAGMIFLSILLLFSHPLAKYLGDVLRLAKFLPAN